MSIPIIYSLLIISLITQISTHVDYLIHVLNLSNLILIFISLFKLISIPFIHQNHMDPIFHQNIIFHQNPLQIHVYLNSFLIHLQSLDYNFIVDQAFSNRKN